MVYNSGFQGTVEKSQIVCYSLWCSFLRINGAWFIIQGSELYSSNVAVGNDMHEMNGNENAKTNKGGNTMADSGVQPNERPRLNLKPRSQAIGGQSEETGGKER